MNPNYDYAAYYADGPLRRVEFSNGQPAWTKLNGRGLRWVLASEVLSALEADGWELTEVDHSMSGTFRPGQSQLYHLRRAADGVSYAYEEIVLKDMAGVMRDAMRNQLGPRHLVAALEPVVTERLRPYLLDGWELDPHPSAMEPLLSHFWLRWKVKSIKVRLRRELGMLGD